jgi:hypothetical protein
VKGFVVLLLIAGAVLLVAFGGCQFDVQVIGAGGFADQLEETGLAGIPISDVRCSEGLEGWDYVCTYEREGAQRTMGFLVNDWDEILATSDEFRAGRPIDPAPGQNVPWQAPAP